MENGMIDAMIRNSVQSLFFSVILFLKEIKLWYGKHFALV